MRHLAADTSDGIDIADVVRTVRRQWRAVATGTLLGVAAAALVLLLAPRRYDGRATLLARTSAGESGGSILGRLGSVGDLVRSGGVGGIGSQFESELQVLRSRLIAGRIVDSLQLQVLPRDPRGLPALALVAGSDLPGLFAPRQYRFERQPNGAYRTTTAKATYELTPGEPGRIDIGSLTLRNGNLPPTLTLKLLDRDDAIDRMLDHMETGKAGGEVAKIAYRGEDSVTAAAVPNLVVAYYLERRKTVDRGANQRRVEYVRAQIDSTAGELAARERALREYQESSGILDAQLFASAQLQGAVALRESLTVSQVEEAVMQQMLAQQEAGQISTHQLAAYPAFIRGTAISALAAQLTEAEAARNRLLELRTTKDPEVLVMDENIKALEAQMLALTKSYANSISRHRAGLAAQVDSMQRAMLALPVAAEKGGRLQRDIVRLTSIYTALQAQLVEARLSAIGEGGEVRPVDLAAVPRKPAFPAPLSTLGLGTAGGLVAGLVAALLVGWFGRWFRDPLEIERATGVAVQNFQGSIPLLFTGNGTRTLLIAPLAPGAQASAVAQRVAQTAAARALQTKLLDLTAGLNGGSGVATPAALIDNLEAENGMLVVQLPDLTGDAAVAAMRESRPVLLVAPPGPVDRATLGGALDLLRRVGVPCAGVIISDAPTHRLRG